MERTGTEPVTARSALGLRLVLAAVYTPLFVLGAVVFSLWAASAGPGSVPSGDGLAVVAGVCAALAVLAAVDLVVVVRRRRRERGGRG
ncbi:hypothetical protein HCK00_19340 [Streptomyces sp. PLAI1-29]|uniref:Uncharacterized protein n=1 Tax=Streptomyces zingiberis TaxID=2053010 RepID=A0ABX1C1I5_9ACTN|nr:DUF6343 family protein [Streptomyces zingiberis]NJQ02636.1 hypothetical protein [Streptomyces zingiberis]